MQPFIHDCSITVQEVNQAHTFRVFCKNHQRLPTNKAIKAIAPISQWKGDIVVMRSGKRGHVVNMRNRDAALADFVVKRYGPDPDDIHSLLTMSLKIC
jgi:hypothetical protein